MILIISGVCFILAILLMFSNWWIPAHANVNLNIPIFILLFISLSLIIYNYWPEISSAIKNM